MQCHELVRLLLAKDEKVAGEIRNAGGNRAPSRTLKRGAFLAVLLVSVLYVLVTVGYVRPKTFDQFLFYSRGFSTLLAVTLVSLAWMSNPTLESRFTSLQKLISP